MPINADVLVRLDERTARLAAEQLEQQFTRAGQDAGSAFSDAVGRHLPAGVSRHAQQAGRDAGSMFASELESGVRGAISGVAGQFGTLGRAAESAFNAIPAAASTAALGVAGIAAAAVAAGKALYDLGKQWDDIADSITVRTGKVGADLDNLTRIVGDVGSTTAASLSAIGDIATQISQAMPDLAANNDAMRQMTSNLAYLDANGQAVNIRELGMAFRAFGVSASEQITTLDRLNTAAQNTGIPINELISTVRAGAPQFRQFGLDIGQATGLLASFSQAGVAPEQATVGLRTALKNVGGEGKNAADGLAAVITQIKALHDTQQEGAAQQLAQDTFGTRNAAAFLQVIESGTLSVDNLNKALEQTGLSIAEQQHATDDWAQSLEKIKNTIATGLKPVADNVFGSINEQLQWLTGNLGLASDKANDLASAMASAASVPITPDSALGRMLTPGGLPGGLTPGVAGPLGGAAAGGYQPPGSGLYGPGGALAPSWGSHQISPRGGSSAGGSSSAAAAQVPYGELPALAAGVPLTPEVYSAQTSLWDANHALAEKQARVQQIQADNTAKAEDLIAAQNDVDKAKRDQHEAELRFAQTQQNALEKQYKQLDKAATDLGQIGAQLDSDFGISKGLGGIVENITKMVANLAAAPVIGALAGGQMGLGFKPGEAGSGLSSILAGAGAFGPQLVAQPSLFGQPSAAPSAMGPAAWQPGGYSPAMPQAAAPRPGESARDFAHRVMMPFWQSQGFTVGDHAADQYGEHQAGALDIMVPNLAAGNSVLGQVLSDPNVYGAIFNQQSYGYGHGPIPQGMPDRGSPTQNHMDHVHAWYRPGRGDNIAAGSPGQGYPMPWNLGGAAMPGAPGAPDQTAGGPTLIGGLAPPVGKGKGGISGGGGGLIGLGISAAQSAMAAGGLVADAAGGGGGGSAGAAVAAAAMQIGVQEINRAIAFGSQAAGIAASGLMETFLPTGASELAQNNWLTRIIGGLVGAAPVLPNLAAGSGKKTPEGLTPEQAAQFGHQGSGKPPGPMTPEEAANVKRSPGLGGAAGQPVNNTFNTTVNNNRPTEDGTGKDLTYHLGAMASAPGMS